MIDQPNIETIFHGGVPSKGHAIHAPVERHSWSFAERVAKARSILLPGNLVGDLLAKPWIDTAIPASLLLVIGLLLAWLLPGFFDPSNLSDTGRQWGEVGFLTLGMMVVVLSGGIDLSVGAIYGLSSFATIAALHALKLPVLGALLLALVVGGGIGLINGILVGVLKMRAFLSTLAVLIIGRSAQEALALRYGASLLTDPGGLQFWYWFGEGSLVGVPISLVLLLIAAAGTHFLLTRVSLGWRIQAVGGSRRAAYNTGIPISRIVAFCYVFSGVCAGMAGFLYSARTANPGAEVGGGFEIIALSAAILGGNTLGGGKGSASKALLGALIVIIVINAIVALGLRSGASSLALGITLLCAVLIDARWTKNRDRILARSHVAPAYFEPEAIPAIRARDDGKYPFNRDLCSAHDIAPGCMDGPSDVVFDSKGWLYTVSKSGDVLRLAPPLFDQIEVFAHIGGEPTGLAVGNDDTLFVGVYGMGLYAVKQDRSTWKLTDRVQRSFFSIKDDSRIRAAHALDAAPDGRIFFCETSGRADAHAWTSDALEMRASGRLLSFDPTSGATQVVLKRLLFPTGVCIESGGESLLFSEAWASRVSRYWLAGPRKGEVETIAKNLPGFPANISRASDGHFWVAMLGARTPLHDLSMRMPGARKRMARRVASDEWLCPNLNSAFVVKLANTGHVVQFLWNGDENSHAALNTAREHDGHLYLGGVFDSRLSRIQIPAVVRTPRV